MQLAASVAHNVALLALAGVVLAALLRRWRLPEPSALRQAVVGLWLGLVGAFVILAPIEGPLGSTFDSRAAPIVFAGYFGGPLGAAVACVLTAGARGLIGGPVAVAGMASVVFYGALGVVIARLRRDRPLTRRCLLIIAVATCAAGLPTFFLLMPLEISAQVLASRGPVLMAANLIGVLALGLVLRELFALEAQARRLDRQAAALERELGAAQAASGSKSRFVAMLSHELRTPLASLVELASRAGRLLTEAGDAPGAARDLDRMRRGGLHLLSLVEDALEVERIEQGGRALRRDSLRLGELFEEAVALVWGQAQRRQVTLTVEPTEVEATGDRRALVQCLVNLASNAVKASPPGGEVRLSAERRGDAVRVTVRDHGRGMAGEAARRAGEPFLCGPRSELRSGGVGLGLAITKRLIETLGGSIRFETPDGGGTAVVLTAPAGGAGQAGDAAPQGATMQRRLVAQPTATR